MLFNFSLLGTTTHYISRVSGGNLVPYNLEIERTFHQRLKDQRQVHIRQVVMEEGRGEELPSSEGEV